MAKIKEQNEKGKGKDFFRTNDIVGIPFEILEDINEFSDFRETKKKDLKPGEEEKQAYQIIDIVCNGEKKEWHLTMSALRSLRNAMPARLSTWKGQRCVVNSLASGFTPTKITRLMGDYAMPKDQMQFGQENVPKPKEEVSQPLPLLTTAQKTDRFFKEFSSEGMNPGRLDHVLIQVYGELEFGKFVFNTLKNEGKVYQDDGGIWRKSA